MLSVAKPKFGLVQTKEVMVRYLLSGEAGNPVLLLHGWGGSVESWRPVFDELAKSNLVVAVDLPGHGESDTPLSPWGVSDYASCMLQVMEYLGLEKPCVIGHSFGGKVAIQMAALYPDCFSKMILVNSAGVNPSRPPKYYLKVVLAKTGKLLARYLGKLGRVARDSIYKRIGSKDYVSAGPLRATFVKIVNEDLTKLLPQVKLPTLLIWGKDDKDTPLSSGEVMSRLIPNASLVVFDYAGHFAYLDQYNKFMLLVKQFLKS